MYKSARLHTPLFEGAEARSAFEAAYTPQQSKVERGVRQSLPYEFMRFDVTVYSFCLPSLAGRKSRVNLVLS